MPVTPSYPGVYIEEIPSGVRTVMGVPTSITAFIGRTPRGPANEPVTIASFGDFERRFGGLALDFPVSYAVRDFYLNGGSQAIVVRLATGAAQAEIDLGFPLKASSVGDWGNRLYAAVDYDGITDAVAERFGVDSPEDLFNLTVAEVVRGEFVRVEQFKNLAWSAASTSARRADRVLAGQSNLVTVAEEDLPAARPAESAEGTEAPTIVTSAGTRRVMTAATADSGVESDALEPADFKGSAGDKTGIYALDKADLFNLLCIPPDARDGDTDATVYQEAAEYCYGRRAFLIVDPPVDWGANKEQAAANARDGLADLGLGGPAARNAALYFPRVVEADPLRDEQRDVFVPCGAVAGAIARTDATRGVWKAPAGLDAAVNGTLGLQANLTDAENGMLNPLGINCLRSFPNAGRVIWGARTLRGADQLADEYKYIPVRRLALFVEETLYRSLKWVVFEPNDEPLWSQIRLNVGAFMHSLFRQGAFQGTSPRDAYFVKCDKETTTQNDINQGVVNIVVGFAPLKPAEFVIIKLQQMAGQVQA